MNDLGSRYRICLRALLIFIVLLFAAAVPTPSAIRCRPGMTDLQKKQFSHLLKKQPKYPALSMFS